MDKKQEIIKEIERLYEQNKNLLEKLDFQRRKVYLLCQDIRKTNDQKEIMRYVEEIEKEIHR